MWYRSKQMLRMKDIHINERTHSEGPAIVTRRWQRVPGVRMAMGSLQPYMPIRVRRDGAVHRLTVSIEF